MRDPIIGIDLGTSNTVVAHADETGAATVLADAGGFKIHPSVVSFHPTGGVVVGAAAKQRKVIDPKNTIFSVKRLIGRSYNSHEVQTAKQRMPYQIKEGANQLPLIVTRGGEFAIPELSAIVLDHARNIASTALQTDVARAVVTVPASFNEGQRSATATAGSIAGLTVVRVLNEPTAAALAYGHMRNLRQTIAVYDFGGGTFDITILKLEDEIYEVLGTSGDTFLGGDDLDERLVDRMVEKFLVENRVDLRSNEVSMMRLRAVAEQTKIELSRRSRAVVRIDEIAYGPNGKPLDLQIEIRRDEFVTQVADIIDRTFPVCEESLKYAGLTIDHIDDVILVGGTTKIPYVRDQVAKFFAKAPRTDVNPEEAVAVGAALQATALERMLERKSPSRAPVPVGFDSQEGTFGDDPAFETSTYAPGQLDAMTDPEVPIPQVTDELDPLDQTAETQHARGAKRQTSGYSEVIRPPQHRRATERPTTRGGRDVFEELTPLPVTPNAPVIGRLTKPGVAGPPPTPKIKTSQSVPAQRAPAVPSAAPHARTMMIDPPASALRSPNLDDDVDFSDGTEKGFVDLDFRTPAPAQAKTLVIGPRESATEVVDVGISPASTAKGFAPPTTYPVQRSPVVIDVTPRGLGIGTVAGFCEELIRRNSRVPTEIRKLFTTSRDQQSTVRIIVVQGESRRIGDNVVIGDLRLEDLPSRPRGETSIEVTFMLDANGILVVRARDPQTGKEQRASLDIVGTIPQADVSASRDKLQALRR